jgi:2-methylcitrate dehydratase PrpD
MASVQFSDLSKKAIDEGKRGVLDWVGCALAGSRHPTPCAGSSGWRI